MLQKLASSLLPSRCPHQFSWPRRMEDGSYYQICVICGGEYGYDWEEMRRTGPLSNGSRPGNGKHSNRAAKRDWKPRARRIQASLPAQIRLTDSSGWSEATIENISETGVLVRTTMLFQPEQTVSLMFQMPAQLAGRHSSKVICGGRVVRVTAEQDVCSAALAIISCIHCDKPGRKSHKAADPPDKR